MRSRLKRFCEIQRSQKIHAMNREACGLKSLDTVHKRQKRSRCKVRHRFVQTFFRQFFHRCKILPDRDFENDFCVSFRSDRYTPHLREDRLLRAFSLTARWF